MTNERPSAPGAGDAKPATKSAWLPAMWIAAPLVLVILWQLLSSQ